MHLTAAPATVLDLSCYTTNLAVWLTRAGSDVYRRLGESVRLSVRVDLPTGELAFSHHTRVDRTPDGRELAYRGATGWQATQAELLDLVTREGQALVVGNTRHLPWSPAYGRAGAPHWMLVRGHRDGRWLVLDRFAALTPYGSQEPYLGWVDDPTLARALTPLPGLPPESVRRDTMALGQEAPMPSSGQYRWLTPVPATSQNRPDPGPGEWLHGLEKVLPWLASVLRADPMVLPRYVDDLWAAGRHHSFQLAFAAANGTADPEHAAVVVNAWGELSRSLRFAAQSAARGRARPGVVDRAFEQLLTDHRALSHDMAETG